MSIHQTQKELKYLKNYIMSKIFLYKYFILILIFFQVPIF